MHLSSKKQEFWSRFDQNQLKNKKGVVYYNFIYRNPELGAAILNV